MNAPLPLVRPLPPVAPLAALRTLAALPQPFLLHAAADDPRSRWSFAGADPFFAARGGDWSEVVARFRALARETADDALVLGRPPFAGGAVGYWSYDFGRRLERLPSFAADDLGLPDFALGFYDVVLAIERASGACTLVSSGLPERGDARWARAEARLEAFARRIAAAVDGGERGAARPHESGAAPLVAHSTFSRAGYRAAVERVRDHIARGDLFQANLSQRWSLALPPAPPDARGLALLESLAARSPAPFAAFLGFGDHAVASSSPERFLELRGGRVETRPIKGTRPRGATRAEDARLAAELLASEKDRAENVMIVDVLRNDLGRVCVPGSVETTALFELETFAQVHHLTSAVAGRLAPGVDAFDLLAACFPGGSITGAPKIRAMEILESLEPVRRHVYTGAIGWLDWNGDADWNVAIRTATATREALHFAAGGGITADSDADAEYEETLAKAEGMRVAIADALGADVSLGERAVAARA